MARSPLFDIYDPYGELDRQARLGLLNDDEDMDILGVLPLGGRKPTLSDLMPEEERSGMLQTLASGGLSGLATAGYALDTLGSAVRGALAGKPTSVFGSSEERVSGRDLLRQYGLIGPEDTWLNFAGGLLTEIATDPLSYLNPFAILGRGAYGTAGKALKNADLLQDASLLARQQDKGLRTFLRDSTPETILGAIPEGAARDEATKRFANAAKGLGADAADLMSDPAAGLMEFRFPWQTQGQLISGGAVGKALASGLDYLGEQSKRAPFIGPVVNRATAVVDPSVLGEVDPDRQWLMREATSTARNARKAVDQELGTLQWDAMRADASRLPAELQSFSSPRIQNAVRDLVVANGDINRLVDQEAARAVLGTPQWRAVYEDFAKRFPEAMRSAEEAGLPLKTARGRAGDEFFPSQSIWFENAKPPELPDRLGRKSSPYTAGRRQLQLQENLARGRDPAYALFQREQTFRRLMGGDYGRDLQQRLISATDADIPGIMEEAFAKLRTEDLAAGRVPFRAPGADEVEELRSFAIDPSLTQAEREAAQKSLDALTGQLNERNTKLGDLLRRADTQFADKGVGLFDEPAFDAARRYASSRAGVDANAKIVKRELMNGAVMNPADQFAGGGWMPLSDAAAKLGFDPELFASGVDNIDELAVNEKLVASLGKLMPLTAQTTDTATARLWNTFTNAFKIGALANPAYHFRNLYSGQVANAMGQPGMNPVEVVSNALAGYRAGKGNYEGLLDRLRTKNASGGVDWAAPGFEDMTDEDILRKVMGGLSRSGIGEGEIADLAGIPEQAMSSLFPGASAAPSPPLIGKDGILYDPNRSWRDWSTVRGVDLMGVMGDRETPSRTLNPLLQLHERAGRSVEDANRLGSYISQLRRGVSPDAAAEMVYKTQVDYRPQAFSETERKIKQFVPFYSYPRGIAPLVAESVLYNPGGLQGKAIRAVTRGTEPSEENFLPEYLRQSAAFALPESFGGRPAENLQRVVNNVDLPFEGLLNLFSPGIGNTAVQRFTDSLQKTGTNLLGQLNPAIKAPLEMILNRQLYTGRELSDLYSVLEKDLGPIGRPLEQLLVNFVPGGTKLNSIYRTARDERLSPTDRAFKLLVNNTLGLKLTDVDQDKTRRQAARDMLNQLLETTPGVRTYENITVPDDVLRRMPEQQRRMYLLYRIIQSEAAKKARERKQTAMDPMELLGVVDRA
jgi:hypothetical protein